MAYLRCADRPDFQAYPQRYPVSISTKSDLRSPENAGRSRSPPSSMRCAQAGAVQNARCTHRRDRAPCSASQSSIGILQATQAGNQLFRGADRPARRSDCVPRGAGPRPARWTRAVRPTRAGARAAPPIPEPWPALSAAARSDVPLRPTDGREASFQRGSLRARRRCPCWSHRAQRAPLTSLLNAEPNASIAQTFPRENMGARAPMGYAADHPVCLHGRGKTHERLIDSDNCRATSQPRRCGRPDLRPLSPPPR